MVTFPSYGGGIFLWGTQNIPLYHIQRMFPQSFVGEVCMSL